ncbi:hypothetical protein [Listeria monocytogenes]|uniref:hypothetical protein n=1 Tax=Listeria monocytogenes TaxID=1639 RepID=UPI0021CB6FCA|nr:hypothetical protein [Listeria monocytogenes]
MNVDQDKGINKLFPYSISFNSTCKFQVATSKGDILLKVEEQNNCYETKSLKILYDYILNASKNSETLELYTVWNSEKDLPLTHKPELFIENLTIVNLGLCDRELLVIKSETPI